MTQSVEPLTDDERAGILRYWEQPTGAALAPPGMVEAAQYNLARLNATVDHHIARANAAEQKLAAHRVWDILVLCAGASDDWQSRLSFVSNWPTPEYRFCGSLGFGGKVWADSPVRVTCYREDETPERRTIIDRTNAAFVDLAAEAD